MEKEQPKILSLNGFLAFQILHELQGNKLCGDELANIIGGRKGRKLTPGTIYPALKFLREKKLVKHKKTGRKKIYNITDFGKKEYELMRENFHYIFKGVIKKYKK